MHGIYLAHIQTAASVAHRPAATGGSAIIWAVATVATILVPLGIVFFVGQLPPRPEHRDDGDTDSGWGRGGPGGPPGPGGGPPPPESGPVWWPEFERQFAAHVERTRRTEPAVVTPQPEWP